MAEPHVVLAAMTAGEARAALARCCGSARWVDAMLARRPWPSAAALAADAAASWWGLKREDWLEAFAHHPRIGAGGTDAWSRQEQAAAAGADAATQRALRAANDRYLERFGYIFIVCATGKSAAEVLRLIEARLGNDPDRELAIAAGEQARIIHLRLEKLGA
ncbi:MAG TPA: 2-oxo-4-hydroxy-4-carboxy-5-ureidoimidazoline decarboxylase [Polyangia bacterium]|nr:2-oxo-4-hydroxy-4-carboxy-5-ureidoimidazoline decarboxylase [Polyangia bacterium]